LLLLIGFPKFQKVHEVQGIRETEARFGNATLKDIIKGRRLKFELQQKPSPFLLLKLRNSWPCKSASSLDAETTACSLLVLCIIFFSLI
jgi:hypothetical protein